jgi:hypothetical protein
MSADGSFGVRWDFPVVDKSFDDQFNRHGDMDMDFPAQ